MSKVTKIWLIFAVSLVLIGCMIFGGTMSMIKWDFTKLSTTKVETNTYNVSEKFNDISINTETADIIFLPSEDKECKVVCIEEVNSKHSVKVENDTLLINIENNKKWFEYIGIDFNKLKITVYLPKNEYGSLSIKSNTGDVEIPDSFKFDSIDISLTTGYVNCNASGKEMVKVKVSTGDITLDNIDTKTVELSTTTGDITLNSVVCDGDVTANVSTGHVKMTNVECDNCSSKGTTSNIRLTDVIVKSKLTVQRSTGDVVFDKSDAHDIFIKTTTGDVSGSLLSSKVFITDVTTGKVNVPKLMTGGVCEIEVTTGDVNITVEET